MTYMGGFVKFYMMNSNMDFKSFLKFMGRNKFYTAINIFGFSVSLMFVILIAVYAERELNIDKRQANGDRIAVLANEESMGTAVPVAYWLEERYPEIEKVCPAIFDRDEQQIIFNDKKYVAKTAYVDSTFFEIFSFELLDGGREQALQESYGAVISESFAHKLFGNENPMGRCLDISDSTTVTITGVMRDIDRSVIPYVDVLLRIERVAEFNPSLSKDNAGNAIDAILYTNGYENYLRDKYHDDWEERVENVREILSFVTPESNIVDALTEMPLMTDQDSSEMVQDAVNMLTLHAAKGLEYPVVFMVGMEEGIFPTARAIDGVGDLSEERRLCYVGMTRARERLYMSCAASRMLFGGWQHNRMSRFLGEIPQEVKEFTDDEAWEKKNVDHRADRRRWRW